MSIENNWFSETEALWPGQRMCLKVENVIEQFRSEFQDILVFQSETYGKVLVLDGVIQLTERDEFAYQEMMVHVPLFAHPNPKKVCIIGGGDGGVLREVAKHKSVEKIIMCELDKAVCDVSKKHFAETMATAFDDPRVTLLHEDGAQFLKNTAEKFDCIIVDSSDPVGPAEVLFEKEFYVTMRKALNSGGIVCAQGECMWLHIDVIRQLIDQSRVMYGCVRYGYTTIPTYPSGQIGFLICCDSALADPQNPTRPVPESMQPTLRYYSSDIHRASFVLPAFVVNKLPSDKPLAWTSRVALEAIRFKNLLKFSTSGPSNSGKMRGFGHLGLGVAVASLTLSMGVVLGYSLSRR